MSVLPSTGGKAVSVLPCTGGRTDCRTCCGVCGPVSQGEGEAQSVFSRRNTVLSFCTQHPSGMFTVIIISHCQKVKPGNISEPNKSFKCFSRLCAPCERLTGGSNPNFDSDLCLLGVSAL